MYKDNFKYMPLNSKVKYLNLYTAARLIMYEFMFYAFQRLPLIQLSIPLALEIYVFILVVEGHTKYDCFESSWATARYLLQQVTIIFILSLAFLNTAYFSV